MDVLLLNDLKPHRGSGDEKDVNLKKFSELQTWKDVIGEKKEKKSSEKKADSKVTSTEKAAP